jgi:hypothetical protein
MDGLGNFGSDWAAIVLVLYRYYTTTQIMFALILTCVCSSFVLRLCTFSCTAFANGDQNTSNQPFQHLFWSWRRLHLCIVLLITHGWMDGTMEDTGDSEKLSYYHIMSLRRGVALGVLDSHG